MQLPWEEPAESDMDDLADLLKPIYDPLADEMVDNIVDDPLGNMPIILTGIGSGLIAVNQGWVDEIEVPNIPVWDYELGEDTWDVTVDLSYQFPEDPWELEPAIFLEPRIEWTHYGPIWTIGTGISLPIPAVPIFTAPATTIDIGIQY